MDDLINNFGKLNFTPEAKNELDNILNSFNNINLNSNIPKSPKISPINNNSNDKIDIELNLSDYEKKKNSEITSLIKKESIEPLRFNYAVYKEINKLLSYYSQNDYKIQRVFKTNDIVEIEFGRLNFPNQFMTLSLNLQKIKEAVENEKKYNDNIDNNGGIRSKIHFMLNNKKQSMKKTNNYNKIKPILSISKNRVKKRVRFKPIIEIEEEKQDKPNKKDKPNKQNIHKIPNLKKNFFYNEKADHNSNINNFEDGYESDDETNNSRCGDNINNNNKMIF